MPAALTYPGVYIEEISSGVRTITGVATSITAFIGSALRGPCDDEGLVTINNYGDFERIFGGLWVESSLGYAVRDFYLNGGSKAVIVRLYHSVFQKEEVIGAATAAVLDVVGTGTNGADAKKKATDQLAGINAPDSKVFQHFEDVLKKEAKAVSEQFNIIVQVLSDDANKKDIGEIINLASDAAKRFFKYAALNAGAVRLEAAYPGKWGSNLRAVVDFDVSEDVAINMGLTKSDLFNLTIRDAKTGFTERYLNLSYINSSRRIDKVLKEQSNLVRWDESLFKLTGKNSPTDPDILVSARSAVNAAEEQLAAAKKATPLVQENIAAAQDNLKKAKKNFAGITISDAVTEAEKKLAEAKAKSNRNIEEEATLKTALENAQKMLNAAVSDGNPLESSDFMKSPAEKKGLYALEHLYARDGLFNLLCIPPYKNDNKDIDINLTSEAAAYCENRLDRNRWT